MLQDPSGWVLVLNLKTTLYLQSVSNIYISILWPEILSSRKVSNGKDESSVMAFDVHIKIQLQQILFITNCSSCLFHWNYSKTWWLITTIYFYLLQLCRFLDSYEWFLPESLSCSSNQMAGANTIWSLIWAKDSRWFHHSCHIHQSRWLEHLGAR